MINDVEKQIKKVLGNDYEVEQDGIEKDKYAISHLDEITHTLVVATVDFKNKTIDTDTLQFIGLTYDQKRSLTRVLVYWMFEEDL